MAATVYAEQGFIARAVAMAKTILNMDPSRIDVLERVDPEAARKLHRLQRPNSVPARPATGAGRHPMLLDDEPSDYNQPPAHHSAVLPDDDDGPAARHPALLPDDDDFPPLPPPPASAKRHPMVLDDEMPMQSPPPLPRAAAPALKRPALPGAKQPSRALSLDELSLPPQATEVANEVLYVPRPPRLPSLTESVSDV